MSFSSNKKWFPRWASHSFPVCSSTTPSIALLSALVAWVPRLALRGRWNVEYSQNKNKQNPQLEKLESSGIFGSQENNNEKSLNDCGLRWQILLVASPSQFWKPELAWVNSSVSLVSGIRRSSSSSSNQKVTGLNFPDSEQSTWVISSQGKCRLAPWRK